MTRSVTSFISFFAKFDPKLFQVLLDAGLARHLSKGIGSLPPESFRKQVVEVEIILLITVCMNPAGLGEYILTDKGFVQRGS